MENLNAINERIVMLKTRLESEENKPAPASDENGSNTGEPENKGRVIFDDTACQQDIVYPTDLDLLSEAREKIEQLIDQLYDVELHHQKPHTYRQVARKRYFQTAQKKNKSRKEIVADKYPATSNRFLNHKLHFLKHIFRKNAVSFFQN